MKEYLKNLMLSMMADARKKRMEIEAKQAREQVEAIVNLPSSQRKRWVKKQLWDVRKKLDTPYGKSISDLCDTITSVGKALDKIRKDNNDPNIIIDGLELHNKPAEEVMAAESITEKGGKK